jgi:hypothetical protein
MSFTRILLALTVACAGCAKDSLDDPIGPSQPRASSGEVDVLVKVSGDASLGPASYGVRLDNVLSGMAVANEILRVFPREGSYLVSLAPFSSWFFPTWCLPTSVGARNVSVVAGRGASAEFEVTCPPLIGTAQLTLVVSASGSNVPAEFQFLVARVSGPPYSVAVQVPANSSKTVEVSVGSLRTSIVLSRNCSRSYTEILFGSGPRVVRARSIHRLTFTVSCR